MSVRSRAAVGPRRRDRARRTLFPILRERGRQRAGTLSGGQRKLSRSRARLLPGRRCSCSTSRPQGSRRARSTEVFEKLAEIASLGIGIVMVEQNARRALALSHRGYVLDMGRNAFEGTGAALLRRPAGGGALPRIDDGNTTRATPGLSPA